jgi:hypothetical protein
MKTSIAGDHHITNASGASGVHKQGNPQITQTDLNLCNLWIALNMPRFEASRSGLALS